MKRLGKLISIAQDIGVLHYSDYRIFLSEIYRGAKDTLEKFTYMEMSELLGYSKSNAIHLIVNHKRSLSQVAAQKIASKLELRGLERKYFLTVVKHNDARLVTEKEVQFKKMVELKAKSVGTSGSDELMYYSEWYVPIIAELIPVDIAIDQFEIRKKLLPNLLPKQISLALDILVRLGRIDKIEDKYRKSASGINSIIMNKIPSNLVSLRYHQEALDLARLMLTELSSQQREFRTVTVRLPFDALEEVRKMIEKLSLDILNLENSDETSEVMQINLNAFVVTSKEGQRQ
jgi:uncharacterized protein (TIGR02147 family)